MSTLYQLHETEDFILDKIEEMYEVDEHEDEEVRADRYEQMAQRHHAWQMSKHPVEYHSLHLSDMLTQRDLESHDDYEMFAKYLGIDYDTYYEMMIGADDDSEDLMVGISNANQSKSWHPTPICYNTGVRQGKGRPNPQPTQ